MDKKYWEKWIGKWCFYFGFHTYPQIGFNLKTDDISMSLLFVSFGVWK